MYLQSVPSISKTIPSSGGAFSVPGFPRGAKRRVDEAILKAGLLYRNLVEQRFVMRALLFCSVRENMWSFYSLGD
jgi:hypothetical protein